jgi:energy-coupling factor transporter ATP-binding protein EcfA2
MAVIDTQPFVLVLDEPEHALHRRAERHLADGLALLAHEAPVTIVVATHSPAFLVHREASLIHVRRGASHPRRTEVSSLDGDMRQRLEELGLDAADLLQLCTAVLLVEGLHDEIVFDELFHDEFERLGVLTRGMSGAKSLRAWDYQVLDRFTDVPIVAVVDNDSDSRIQSLWQNAVASYESNPSSTQYISTLGEIDSVRSGEARYIHQLCIELIKSGSYRRLHLETLTRRDIIEYLPVAAIAKGAPKDATWDSLRAEARKGEDFKKWLRKYGGTYSDVRLRAGVRRLDTIHPDFLRVLERLRTAVGSRSARDAM